MIAELNGFKVVYRERVLRAIALMGWNPGDEPQWEVGKTTKPKVIEILAVNEDGNIVSIVDEAWMFQFIPVIGRGD